MFTWIALFLPLDAAAQGTTLIFASPTDGAVRRIPVGGTNPEVLVDGVFTEHLTASARYVFYTLPSNSVQRLDLDGGSPVEIMKTSSTPYGIEWDPYSERLYVLQEDQLLYTDEAGTSSTVIWKGDVPPAGDVAVDGAKSKIYWNVAPSIPNLEEWDEKDIVSADLDGGNIETILERVWYWEGDLAVDALRDRLFVTGSVDDAAALTIVNLDGTSAETIPREWTGVVADPSGNGAYLCSVKGIFSTDDAFNGQEPLASAPCQDIAVLGPDADGDGIVDGFDNCVDDPNTNQEDADGDGLGDACDDTFDDIDGDGVADTFDNCPEIPNAGQEDADEDGVGDACEASAQPDSDGDGIPDAKDNCPSVVNFLQEDDDGNGIGDACEPAAPPVSTDDESSGCHTAAGPTGATTALALGLVALGIGRRRRLAALEL